jgi:hypothetical protein
MSIAAMMDGKGALETNIVWGTFRNIPHAYRQFVYSKHVRSIMWVTLCSRKLMPKGGITAEHEDPPLSACFQCRTALAGEHKRSEREGKDE